MMYKIKRMMFVWIFYLKFNWYFRLWLVRLTLIIIDIPTESVALFSAVSCRFTA